MRCQALITPFRCTERNGLSGLNKMATIKINSEWIESDENFRPEYDCTFGSLGIIADNIWLTEFELESGARGRRLDVPAYPLAEWMAENWWSLLYEPEKGEQSRRDPAFRARHWFGTAREGFALPDAWMHSSGHGAVSFRTLPAFFQHARLALHNQCDLLLRTDDASRELASFINSVVQRLTEKGVVDTNLQQIWNAFNQLDQDEKRFCSLLGALGISPYEATPDLTELLTQILGDASEAVTEDFCEAADEGDLLEAAADMRSTLDALESEPQLDLSKLFRLHSRREGSPKRAGLNAARAVRDQFRISSRDPQGGEAFLNAFNLQPNVYDREGINEAEDPVLHGSLRRCANRLQFNLIRKQVTARRFDAARACYMAWAQASDGDRLVTRARVPDQQASRIFAAEILAPIDIIRARASNKLLSPFGIKRISEELHVSGAVIAWQASHNGISVVGKDQGHWG